MKGLREYINEAKFNANKNDTYSLQKLEPFEVNIILASLKVALKHEKEIKAEGVEDMKDVQALIDEITKYDA